MTDKTEALRLADVLDTATAVIHRLGNDVLIDFGDGTKTVEEAAAELRRLHAVEVKYESLARAVMMDQTYHDKVIAHPGVQGLAQLGRNAIDRVQELQQANASLAGALDMIRETLNGGNVEDLLYIINEALEKYRRTA